jgi:glycerol-3-phosphate cytidylyltransferase-like family protein
MEFLQSARDLGDRLVVCLPSDRVVTRHRRRFPSLPCDQKTAVFRALRFVDEVLVGDDEELGLNFKSEFLRLRPDILAAGADDQYESAKRRLCKEAGAQYVKVARSKTWPDFSATRLVERMRAPLSVPLRVDIAGGWLDVPTLARPDGRVVNCTIGSFASLEESPFEPFGGLGGSAARSILEGRDGVESELSLGVGWQDPAVISETGLCVWRSGPLPVLEVKRNPTELLGGRMALWWTGTRHDTPGVVGAPRDYELIEEAGRTAARAVDANDYSMLCRGVAISYDAQEKEGMAALPEGGELARKYCGGGWGGYALYLFRNSGERDGFVSGSPQAAAIEPYMRFQGVP